LIKYYSGKKQQHKLPKNDGTWY